MTGSSSALPLAGCRVLSLRPVGGHAGLRRAAAACGARVLALSPWRLQPRRDPATRAALATALSAPRVIFTSPEAVRAAVGLSTFPADDKQWFAVGSSTAAALRRAGVHDVFVPGRMDSGRMDSEGLLALPGLQRHDGAPVGLVTAPGGRGLIADVLQHANVPVLRADVYERIPVAPSPRSLAALQALDPTTTWLALSSGGALDLLLDALPADIRSRLQQVRVVAASTRLQGLAHTRGFTHVVIAPSARPRDLLAAAVAAHPLA